MAMIRPKTEMKDSGDIYIGKMPLNWRLASYKYFADSGMGLTILKEEVTDLGVPIYSATQDSSIFGYINNPKLKLGKGDLVIPARGNSIGCTTYVEDDVATCTQTTIYSKVSGINPKFLFYCSIGLKEEWFYYVQTAIPQITVSQVQNNKVPVPPLSEQQAIADYLDETCSKIDEIIAEAKASIDEYKELKQSVIFEAVIKGLDKNVNVYKTGNTWIPLLPVGIKLSRFGLHHDIILGKMLCPNPRNEEDTLEPYYCAANVHFDGVTGELKTMWFNSKEKETYIVHKNDMLIVEGGAGAGGAAIMNEEPPVSAFVQNSIMIVRSHMKDNRYSCYLVQALVKNKYVDVVCNKATIPHFTKEKVSYMPYPVFNRNERNEIANYLDVKCKQIDSLITEKESLINDLEAYKKSLIYEVVTGKRRVV